ncbi:hypothetical protein [Algibacter sp. PT7-4]|uniref:hypothetical protein n=1 Tax=Algibacter ulvanivorans TaxID=3400999 RepID=UPI003AAB18DB
MKKISVFLLFIALASCKNDVKKATEVPSKAVYVDSLYALNTSFEVGDVRRYGVEPGVKIGQHPKLLKDKLDVLMDISELGIKLYFPKGVYDRTLNIEKREAVKIVSDSALFTGAVTIKNSSSIYIDGVIQSLSSFYIQNSNDIEINSILTKTDSLIKKKMLRSTGVSIHGGAKNVRINKVLIKDSGSGSRHYKYIKGGLIVHGHNNEPREIKIDSAIVESSDRHGVYLTGVDIDIKYLHVKKFGVGTADDMAPMEGGIDGEQVNFSGLWIKNCHDSFIDEAIIDTNKSKGKFSVNFDIGQEFRPTTIEKLVINHQGSKNNIEKRIFSRTGVIVGETIEQ